MKSIAGTCEHVIEQQKVKGRDELKKVVLVSHAGGFKGGKGIGNKILDKLFNPFGRAEGGPNEVIGKRHAALEKTIRDSSYDYVIVRTPPIVQMAGDCSEVDLELTQESSFESPALRWEELWAFWTSQRQQCRP